jgi:hypothetical protein
MLSQLADTSGLGLQQIRAFMDANRIAIDSVRDTTSGIQVHGRRESCDIQIKEVAPQGWDVSSMTVFAEGRPLVYVYDGAVYAEQPAWRTWFHYRVWRLLRLVGIELERRTVFGVAATSQCDALNLDLARLTG